MNSGSSAFPVSVVGRQFRDWLLGLVAPSSKLMLLGYHVSSSQVSVVVLRLLRVGIGDMKEGDDIVVTGEL